LPFQVKPSGQVSLEQRLKERREVVMQSVRERFADRGGNLSAERKM
jgi:hypothetical protein